MKFKVIDPFDSASFRGSRAYSTNLDVSLYERAKGSKKIADFQSAVERDWKVLLLTKHRLVTGASAMISEFGFQFFKEHPILLEKELVLPAVGNQVIGDDWKSGADTQALADYYAKRIKSQNANYVNQVKSFFSDNIKSGVGWNFKNNTTNFKKQLIVSLNDPTSVLRDNLADRKLTESQISNFVSELSNSDGDFSRKHIEIAVGKLGFKNDVTDILFKFQELSYNMSGASVVNCESSLPQENLLMDYSIADTKNRRVIASEKKIFCKIFFDLYLENLLQTSAIPADALDFISFEDISRIRDEFHDSEFINNYNKLLNEMNKSFHKTDTYDFYNLDELIVIKKSIEERYIRIFDYVRKKAKEKGANMSIFQQNSNLGYGLGDFTRIGTLSGASANNISYVMDTTSLATSPKMLVREANKHSINFKQLGYSHYLDSVSDQDKKSILEFAGEIHRTIQENIDNRFYIKS